MKNEYLQSLLQWKQTLLNGCTSKSEFLKAWKQITSHLSDEDKRELLIAIHEAGHAVMCWLIGHHFEYVTIETGEDDKLGNLHTRPYPKHFFYDKNTFRCRAVEIYMDVKVIIDLSGYAAQSVYLAPDEPDKGWQTDARNAYRLGMHWYDSKEEIQEYILNMLDAARDSLRKFYLHVVVLAIELLDKKRLNQEEVVLLLKTVPLDNPVLRSAKRSGKLSGFFDRT